MHDKLVSAVKHITELENRLKDTASKLRDSNFTSEEFIESALIKKLELLDITGNICAIDSGLLAYSTHGTDILMLRTVTVNFSYNKSNLLSCSYHPTKIPEASIEVKTALDEHESLLWRSLIRLKIEISAAIDAIALSPLAVLIDGSILPLAKDRPGNDSELFSLYNALIELYKKLYSLCKEKNILLIGVIKDSRGKRFMDIINKGNAHFAINNELNYNDSSFLNYLLKEKERTSVIHYAADQKQPVLKDLDEFRNSLYVCYLKITKNDQPLRIEFLNFDKNFEAAISLAYSLSAISDNYAYPAALTEADLCAALDDRELDLLKQSFYSLEISRPLRRNSRPFR